MPARLLCLLAIALFLSLPLASKALAFSGFTALNYSGSLNGYSETWRDPLDTGEYYCEYVDFGWYYCEGYDFSNVSVDARLYNPAGSVDGYGYAIDPWAATTYFSSGNVVPGTWTAVGDHSVDVWYFYEYCLPYQGCGSTYQIINESLGQTADQAAVACDLGDAYDDNLQKFWGPRATPFQLQHNFNVSGNVFSFTAVPWANATDFPTLQAKIASSFNQWTTMESHACGTVGIQADITAWGNLTTRNLIYDLVSSIGGGCAEHSPGEVVQGGAFLDVIRVLPGDPGPSTCGPQAEVLAHELGHAIGFMHAVPSYTTDIMLSPRAGIQRTVQAHHALILLYYYE